MDDGHYFGLVVGCNYHWAKQREPGMRFVLSATDGYHCLLTTRTTGKSFWVKASELTFIDTPRNKEKARRLIWESLPDNDSRF